MDPVLIIAFTRMPEDDFYAKAEAINAALSANPNFPGPWADPLVGPAELNDLFEAYQAAYNAALNKDVVKVSLRKTARAALMVYLRKLAGYLELVADGDTAKLLTTGYALRGAPGPGPGPGPLPAPVEFTTRHGPLSGQLIGRARKLRGAGSYELQICIGDPGVEANWKFFAAYVSATRMEISGQTPGVKVWARLRGLSTAGPGKWTDPFGLMVI